MIQRDITDRRAAGDALRRSEERYRLLFDSNPHPMWVFDRETLRFVAVNDAAVHKYGYSRGEFLRMTIKDIRPAEDVPRLLASVHHGKRPSTNRRTLWRHRTKDGTVIDVEISSFHLTMDGRPAELVLVNDVTEKLHLEEQLRQAQKMEVIGQMAGGVAHDFNNLLTGILGNLSLAQLAEGDPNRPLLAAAEQAAVRAADLTGKLLGYARRNQLVYRAGRSGRCLRRSGRAPAPHARPANPHHGQGRAPGCGFGSGRPDAPDPGAHEPVPERPRRHARGGHAHAHRRVD